MLVSLYLDFESILIAFSCDYCGSLVSCYSEEVHMALSNSVVFCFEIQVML